MRSHRPPRPRVSSRRAEVNWPLPIAEAVNEEMIKRRTAYFAAE